MFGCIRKLGCLVVLLALGALAYLNRDRLLGRRASDDAPAARPAGAAGEWEPLSPAGATRARRSVQALSRQSGPVFVKLSPGDLASYVFDELARQLPASAENVEASVRNGRVYVRTTVRLSDVGGENVLGPLAGFLGDREPMQFGGRFNVVRPGLAQFRVEEVRVRDFAVPRAIIPNLIGRLRSGAVPEGVANDGLPLNVPASIADVRVSNGQIVLYKTAQPGEPPPPAPAGRP